MYRITLYIFQIANQTVLEQEGLFFLRPVYRLLFDATYTYSLKLPRSKVRVCYKTYDNSYKDEIQVRPGGLSLSRAIEEGLTPG